VNKATGVTVKEQFKSLPLPEKVRYYLALARPFTGVAAVLAGIFLVKFANPVAPIWHGVVIGAILALLQFAGQSINQSVPEEIEIDKLNGKTYRPTVSGKIKLKDALQFGVGLGLIAIGLAFAFSLNLGFFSIIIFLFASLYTLEPIRIKRYFVVNNLWQAISRGFLPVITVWSVYNPLNEPLPYLVGIPLAIWVFGAQTTKDFSDVRGDRAYNVRTFPVVLGYKGATFVTGIFMVISFIMLNSFIAVKALPFEFCVLNILLIPSLVIYHALRRGYKFSLTENNLAWSGFYVTLGLWFIGLGVVRWMLVV